MNLTQHIADEINKNKYHIPLSGITAYHIYNGSLAISNSTLQGGFATTLYTGNGTTQSITTGIDMATQWGSVNEKYGGLVWLKSRSNALDHYLVDTIRGIANTINTDTTAAQVSNSTGVTALSSTGFSLGSLAGTNTNTATYASWNFQTTHRTSGTTNHGQPYTCHYNPYTGFTMVQYTGSGLSGHEIPHMLGRKLGFVIAKSLTTGTYGWTAQYGDSTRMSFNTTGASITDVYCLTMNDTSVVTNTVDSQNNASSNTYILYGWANSYFDANNNLIGNYYTYVDGNGILRFRVHDNLSQSNVMLEMTKATLTTSDWDIIDYTRGNTLDLKANLSNAESTVTANTLVRTASPSKYPFPSSTPNLNLNAVVPFANGIDLNGSKISMLTKNETVSGLTLTQGNNYIYSDNTGAYGVSKYAPTHGTSTYNGFGEYYDLKTNKWYSSPSIAKYDGSSITGLTAGNSGTLATANGTIELTNGVAASGNFSFSMTTVIGKKYNIPITQTSSSDASFFLNVGTTAGGSDVATYTGLTVGSYNKTFVATATTTYVAVGNTTATSGLKSGYKNIAVYTINNDGSVDLSSATPITNSRNYLDAIVQADASGVPTVVTQLPKTKYEDIVKANQFQGKNALIAYALVDMTTTPPTIKNSFNVSSVIRTSNGVGVAYLSNSMDNSSISAICGSSAGGNVSATTANTISFNTGTTNYSNTVILAFGGQN